MMTNMRYDLNIAWRNLRARPVQTITTILVVTVAIALSISVVLLNDGLRRGIVRASDPFGVLVVGPKGSAQQLVLSTILLQGTPIGNIPAHIYEDLVADARVALAVPLAMGDNVGGARIVGTSRDFFELRPSLNEPPTFQLQSGSYFNADFEAVLGSTAAQRLGLTLGDQFVPQHGVTRGLESDAHDIVHTVVGILNPTSSPYDNAVFTTVASVQQIHAEEAHAAEEPTDEEHADEEHADEEHADEEHADEEHADEEHADEEHADDGQITAIFVKPTGFVETNEIWQDFYTGVEAQAAFPGRELGGLFDLLNQGQQILSLVAYLAAAMAALTLFLAVYSATVAREQLLAIMRGLGAGRWNVFRVVLFETVLLALLGAILGRIVGYGAAWAIAAQISAQAAFPVPIRYLPALEPLLWGLPLLLGVLAGLIPAVQAYRVDVVEKLFPS